MIGEDPNREGLVETPKRVERAYDELFAGYKTDPKSILKTFTNEGYREMILVRDIEYYSMCEHHMIPFFGVAHIAYVPGKKITGLSKLPRLVDAFARRLQNQERLTEQIADTLYEALEPKGVAVQLTGKHLCMCARGIKKTSSETITTAFRGDYLNDHTFKADFFAQIKA